MQKVSSLTVGDSRFQLISDCKNSKNFYTFNSVSVFVSVFFESTPSNIEITNSTFTNSNISLGNNTKIRGEKR